MGGLMEGWIDGWVELLRHQITQKQHVCLNTLIVSHD